MSDKKMTPTQALFKGFQNFVKSHKTMGSSLMEKIKKQNLNRKLKHGGKIKSKSLQQYD